MSTEMLLDTKEAAQLLRISQSAVTNLRKNCGLPYIRLGKRVLFKRDALLAYIDNHQIIEN